MELLGQNHEPVQVGVGAKLVNAHTGRIARITSVVDGHVNLDYGGSWRFAAIKKHWRVADSWTTRKMSSMRGETE